MSITPSFYFFLLFLYFLSHFIFPSLSSSLSSQPTYFSSLSSPPANGERTHACTVRLPRSVSPNPDLPHLQLVLAFARRIHRGCARLRSCSDGASPLRPVLALRRSSPSRPPRGRLAAQGRRRQGHPRPNTLWAHARLT